MADGEKDLNTLGGPGQHGDGIGRTNRLGAIQLGPDRHGLRRRFRRAAGEKTHEVDRVGQGGVVRTIEHPGVTGGEFTGPGVALVVGSRPWPAAEASQPSDSAEAARQQLRLQLVGRGTGDVLETDHGLSAGGVAGADHGVHILDTAGSRLFDEDVASRLEDGDRHRAVQGDAGRHADQIQLGSPGGEPLPQAVVAGGAGVAEGLQLVGEGLVVGGWRHLSDVLGAAAFDGASDGAAMVRGVAAHADDGNSGKGHVG